MFWKVAYNFWTSTYFFFNFWKFLENKNIFVFLEIRTFFTFLKLFEKWKWKKIKKERKKQSNKKVNKINIKIKKGEKRKKKQEKGKDIAEKSRCKNLLEIFDNRLGTSRRFPKLGKLKTPKRASSIRTIAGSLVRNSEISAKFINLEVEQPVHAPLKRPHHPKSPRTSIDILQRQAAERPVNGPTHALQNLSFRNIPKRFFVYIV